MRSPRRMDRRGVRSLLCAAWPSPGESGEAAPPTLIGGVNEKSIGKMDVGDRKRSIGIDWIQGTIPFTKMDSLFLYLSEMCGSAPESYNHGFMGYQAAAEWHPYGIKVLWDLDTENRLRHGNRIVLQIGGTGLGCFPAASLYQFCRDLCTRFFFKATRVDLCFDDYEKIITPMEVSEFAKEGSYKGFRKHRPILEMKSNGEIVGDTLYFGTRGKNGGGKFVRFYRKDLESGGEVDSYRWEVEFSKDKANDIFFKLAMSFDITEFATNIAMFIGGAIDFVERGGRPDLDRLAFWEQILDSLGSASLRSPKSEQSIETAMEWVEVSVTPSLEKIRRAIGDDRYYEWLMNRMEDVELRKKAMEQVATYHYVHGKPVSEVPF